MSHKLAKKLSRSESISVNGVCVTVTEVKGNSFTFDAVEETLGKTTLGILKPRSQMNLERALGLGGRLGGHFLTGHVDGMGNCLSVRKTGDGAEISFSLSALLSEGLVEKGSVAVDGVSLTAYDVMEGRFTVSLIPYTVGHTTLRERKSGDLVNIETDILGKYVRKILEGRLIGEGQTLTRGDLEHYGF